MADFLKELPVICKRAEPNLSQLVGPDNSLERQLKLSELQISFVYTTVLAKKCRVRHSDLTNASQRLDIFSAVFDAALRTKLMAAHLMITTANLAAGLTAQSGLLLDRGVT